MISLTKLLTLSILFTLTTTEYHSRKAAERYKVTYDETGDNTQEPELVEEEIYCYHFTWVGPVEDNANETELNCDLVNALGIPCFEPLVFTTGEGRFDGPNITQIEEKCKTQDTINGESCDPYCRKQVRVLCIQFYTHLL